MRGGTNGIGFQIRSAERTFDTAASYAGVIVIGAIGLVANLAFVVVEGRVMRWHHGARGRLGDVGDIGDVGGEAEVVGRGALV
jgi:hypothetical protein